MCELDSGLLKRKPLRSYPNRNRCSTGTSSTPDKTNISNTIGTPIQNINVSSIKTNTPYNKSVSPIGQNVTQIPTQVHSSLGPIHSRPQPRTLMSKPPAKLLQPKMEQPRLKQMQNQRQGQNDQRLQGNAQRLAQGSLNSSQRQQTAQRQVLPSTPLQFQKTVSPQKSQYEQSTSLSSFQNMHSNMDVDSVESSSLQDTSFSSQTDSENSSSESIAFLQKVIRNPMDTIVQHQIKGNTAKMLVMFSNGEQRLITFDIPNEDCTVQDLLEQVIAVIINRNLDENYKIVYLQANITFCGTTNVSLVSDPTLGINYIVEAGSNTSHDVSEHDNSQENLNNLDSPR